jgi:hypothetical protein
MKTFALILALAAGGTAMTIAQPADAQVYVRVAPPAPIVERRPPPPGPGYAWRAGHWQWNGNRYVWVRGYYGRPPYAHASWIPGHWVHRPDGRWVFREGHWS